MPAYNTTAIGISRKIQPIIVTPRCLRTMCPPRTLFDAVADAAPIDDVGALRIKIEPDSSGLADQILVRHELPDATVAAVVPIVADHHVHAFRDHFELVVSGIRLAVGRRRVTDPAAILLGDRLA